ncbi:Peptidyl-prolyl cis-trans isomerase CYP59 [Camellia lanceoleosa]|uniref:Peptidyl-prolyl cis-trans isomerase CYP59 n=1 Tax=Camellia lanceoleosa TaxID=1840588 RepID=A0ACC0H747_9ERIC|nr:Peptidyl-prolyl cis-trans isomerase CYP59 [Camellia lanceoleosa]
MSVLIVTSLGDIVVDLHTNLYPLTTKNFLKLCKMKHKRKTFKAPCTMDEALRVRASPSLPHTMDGASSLYVSRMKQKRKRKTFKALCTMDEALHVQASPSLPRTMDEASSPYVSRMKRKKKTFKAPCTIDEASHMRASPSLPRTMDRASSLSVSSPHTVSTTSTRRGRGFLQGIKEWGTGTKIQDKLVYCPDEFKEVCMRLCRTSWKDHKSKKKSKYWVPFKNDPNIASRVPSNKMPTQWRKLVQY